jgi:hypothetical protein
MDEANADSNDTIDQSTRDLREPEGEDKFASDRDHVLLKAVYIINTRRMTIVARQDLSN